MRSVSPSMPEPHPTPASPTFPRVLLAGGGAIALEAHLPQLRGLPGNRCVVLYELSAARRAAIRKRYRDDVALELPEKLPEGPFDLAVLATPPSCHLQEVLRWRPSCPRFVIERPMARTLEEARAIVSNLEGALMAVHMPRAELAAFDVLKDLYDRGRYGTLQSVQIHDGRVFDWPSVSPALFSKEMSGGGVMMDLGPHILERLLHLFTTLKVEQCLVDGDRGAVEANAVLHLRGDGRIPVTVEMSRNRHLSGTAVFTFAEAEARVGLMAPTVHLVPRQGPGIVLCPDEDTDPVPFRTLVARFYQRRVVEGRSRSDRALEVMRLLDEAYRVARPLQGGF
jgi:predicted dehydrogenase